MNMTDSKEPLLSWKWPFNATKSNDQNDNIYNDVEASTAITTWPNLFDESYEMLMAAILMYAFADLRQLARNGMLEGGAEELIMAVPISVEDVLSVLQQNTTTLRQVFGGDGMVEFYISALCQLKDRHQQQRSALGGAFTYGISNNNYNNNHINNQVSQVLVFDDENHQSELVYGISVNLVRQRITVAFRGSVTNKDFTTDANAMMNTIPNPVVGTQQPREATIIPQTNVLGIHHGFYDYLFGGRRDSPSSKFEVIMAELRSVLQQYPGFRVYCTGHSLGGALATMFAFEIAASTDPLIPKPVTCISVASPKVGNLPFRRAFQALEHLGAIRCLRIANYKDLVTVLPDRGSFSLAYILFCQSHVYRHVGLELKMYRNEAFQFFKTPEDAGYCGLLLKDWYRQIVNSWFLLASLPFLFCCCCGSCQENYVAWHSCKEYHDRLIALSSKLQNIYLNDLYVHRDQLQEGE